MTDQRDNPYYTVVEQDGRFAIRSVSGRTIMVCGDSPSAAHYALLLNDAFKAGLKRGRREP